ncbi:Complex III assembly protein translocase and chaperone [Malassezia japonica]|uniref:Complex III assembly protein translocase and chaperone n=1 Tax=Malassezia japonica TaxID=223818 RepID=A0AAF0J9N2_9BASI|nr:Complex III assembly protein translocase and chaperone [Malassezia japonica]WFD38608.1 Complex III assembly protein translocase and chaperone [Malassezia japonica]
MSETPAHGAPGAPNAAAMPPAEQSKPQGLLASMVDGNPYFSAGFGLMIFGGALAYSKSVVSWGAHAAQRRMLVSLEIPSKDRAHPWFLHWMGAQAQAQALRRKAHDGKMPRESMLEFLGLRRPAQASGEVLPHDPLRAGAGAVSPIRIISRELAVDTHYEEPTMHPTPGTGQERGVATFSLVPGPGTHWFRYHGVWIRLQRERNGKLVDLSTGAPWETVTLTTLSSYSHLFTQLLAEARQLALASTQGKTIIFTSWGAEWRPFGHPRRVRELDSVVLASDKKDELVGDVNRFLSRGSWYTKRGIPYRRGYLLHGAPGSGKTSFITALAGSLDFNICLLNLAERGMTDDKLNHLLSNAPERSILLLEDVDAAFAGRANHSPERHADGYQPSVTFSGLLNALDGVASGESRIIFMTTNHLERLDPALIRPGRVDMICELGDAAPRQVRELLVRFYQADLLEARLDAARRARGYDPAEFAHAPHQTAPDAQTEYYREALKATADELNGAADRLVAEVAHATRRRRAALHLDEDGHTREEPKEVRAARPGFWPRPAARGGVSMAELQGLFIRFPDDPHAAVRAFAEENGDLGAM